MSTTATTTTTGSRSSKGFEDAEKRGENQPRSILLAHCHPESWVGPRVRLPRPDPENPKENNYAPHLHRSKCPSHHGVGVPRVARSRVRGFSGNGFHLPGEPGRWRRPRRRRI